MVCFELCGGMCRADIAVVLGFNRAAFILLDAATLFHPLDTFAREARIDVDNDVRIGVGTGCVVHRKVRLLRGFAEDNLAQRHANVLRFIRRDENLARRRQSAGGDGGIDIGRVDLLVHGVSPVRVKSCFSDIQKRKERSRWRPR